MRFFEQLKELESEVDMHIIGGDLFDRLPNMQELELYFMFVASVGVPTIIYDGNHEATKKHTTFFSHLKEVTANINSNVSIIDHIEKDEFNFSILPYCKLHEKGSIETLPKDLPVFTHVRGEIPPHVKPEVDLDRFADFPVVFAGDLHAHSNTQRNIVYPGSPMTTSFHRGRVKTGYLLIDEDNDFSWEWKEFDLPQLIRKTVKSESEIVPTHPDHTVYELEGDLQELAKVENSELLDKKIIQRNAESDLILDPDMTIEEELSEYLLYILELPEKKVKDIISLFKEHTRG
jgi:DNA repair exonuclease SbcCD nuclease subunit